MGRRSRRHLLSKDIIVRGYDGYNMRWALFLLNHLFPPSCLITPVAATIFFGSNDAAFLGRSSQRLHVHVEEYKENLKKIVDHLKECLSNMLVVLISPPPVDVDGRKEYACWLFFSRTVYGEKATMLPERTNEMTGVYARQCVRLAEELHIPCINLWLQMQETPGWQKKFLCDGLHLTAERDNVVYRGLLQVFNNALSVLTRCLMISLIILRLMGIDLKRCSNRKSKCSLTFPLCELPQLLWTDHYSEILLPKLLDSIFLGHYIS